MKNLILFIFLIILMSNSSFAQTSVKQEVVDKETTTNTNINAQIVHVQPVNAIPINQYSTTIKKEIIVSTLAKAEPTTNVVISTAVNAIPLSEYVSSTPKNIVSQITTVKNANNSNAPKHVIIPDVEVSPKTN